MPAASSDGGTEEWIRCTIRYSSNRQFVGWDEAGHGVVMDAKPGFKGEGTGPRPIELVLYALGGCTAMDVVSVLEKKRQDVAGVEVIVTGTQREDDYPHYYETVHVEYVVSGRGVSEAAVQRAIELSETQVLLGCGHVRAAGRGSPRRTGSWTLPNARHVTRRPVRQHARMESYLVRTRHPHERGGRHAGLQRGDDGRWRHRSGPSALRRCDHRRR